MVPTTNRSHATRQEITVNAIKSMFRRFRTAPTRPTRRMPEQKTYNGNVTYNGVMRVRLIPTEPVPLAAPRLRGGPADMPPRMRMWDARNRPEIHEDLTKTRVIPKISGPVRDLFELPWDDTSATFFATLALKTTRSVDAVVAGLRAYAATHPVAA